MARNETELRGEVGQVISDLASAEAAVDHAQDSIEALNVSMHAVRDEIESLRLDMRSFPRRERQGYRELIRDARNRKAEIITERKATQRQLNADQRRRTDLLKHVSSLRGFFSRHRKSLESNSSRLSGGMPAWVAGVDGIESALLHGRAFCDEQLARLGSIMQEASGFSPTTTVDAEIEYVPEPAFVGYQASLANGNVLKFVDPVTESSRLPIESAVSTPIIGYSVADTIDMSGLSPEEIGISYATALLEATGRETVIALGGPYMWDVMSLDREGKLWISELKGTEKFGPLASSGLLRKLQVKDNEGQPYMVEFYENSREYLQIKAPHVEKRLDHLIQSEKDINRRDSLLELRAKLADAIDQGFMPTTYNTEVIQVSRSSGSETIEPVDVIESGRIDDYISAVQPSRIVQIDVIEGSAASEMMAGQL
jgi:hypothetical protein